MDQQTLFNVLVGIVLAGLGWFGRELWTAVRSLREDIHKIEVELPKTYTPKYDFDRAMQKVSDGLQRIYDKLDEKADKA